MMLLKALRSKPGLGIGVIAGAVLVLGHPWLLAVAFALMFAAGVLVAVLAMLGVKLGRRVDRALPDRDLHPCGECERPIRGRVKYCSETCRELAAERRMRQRVHAERMADYGEIPF